MDWEEGQGVEDGGALGLAAAVYGQTPGPLNSGGGAGGLRGIECGGLKGPGLVPAEKGVNRICLNFVQDHFCNVFRGHSPWSLIRGRRGGGGLWETGLKSPLPGVAMDPARTEKLVWGVQSLYLRLRVFSFHASKDTHIRRNAETRFFWCCFLSRVDGCETK